jgi:hypothetical protein
MIGSLNEFEKAVRTLLRQNVASITSRVAFSGAVDGSALLIDLWRHPGWLMSGLGPKREVTNP